MLIIPKQAHENSRRFILKKQNILKTIAAALAVCVTVNTAPAASADNEPLVQNTLTAADAEIVSDLSEFWDYAAQTYRIDKDVQVNGDVSVNSGEILLVREGVTLTVTGGLNINEGAILECNGAIKCEKWIHIEGVVRGNGTVDCSDRVNNGYRGSITGGTFNCDVSNMGTINGGTFCGSVHNEGAIFDGIFLSPDPEETESHISMVHNNGTISGGTFDAETIHNSGTISGGTFRGYHISNEDRGNIIAGTFEADNFSNYGTISDGIFSGSIKGSGTISGAVIKDVFLEFLTIDADALNDQCFSYMLEHASSVTMSQITLATNITVNGTVTIEYLSELTIKDNACLTINSGENAALILSDRSSVTINEGASIDIGNGSIVFGDDAKLTGDGTLIGSGTLTISNLTADMITVPDDLYYDGQDRTSELQSLFNEQLTNGVVICGKSFIVSGWTVSVTKTDELNYKAAFTNTSDNSKNFDKTITLLQSSATIDNIKTYDGDAETDLFSAGDTITVKADLASASNAMLRSASFTAPTGGQMALFVGDVQVSEPASADANGVYTMTAAASEVLLQSGVEPNAAVTLTAKFIGDGIRPDAAGTVNISIEASAIAEKDGQTIGYYDAENLADAFDEENSGATVTLLKDIYLEEQYIAIDSGSFILDGLGHKLSKNSTTTIYVYSGKLILRNVTVINTENAGIYVPTYNDDDPEIIVEKDAEIIGRLSGFFLNGGILTIFGKVRATEEFGNGIQFYKTKLTINEGAEIIGGNSSGGNGIYGSDRSITVNGGTISGYTGIYCLDNDLIVEGGTISGSNGILFQRSEGTTGNLRLLDGTFIGTLGNAIEVIGDDTTLDDLLLLNPGYAICNTENGTPVKRTESQTGTGTFIIKECPHKGGLAPNDNGYQHGGTCLGCGTTGFQIEDHILGENGKCIGCGAELVAERTDRDGTVRYYDAEHIEKAFVAESDATTATVTLLNNVDLGTKEITVSSGTFTLTGSGRSLMGNGIQTFNVTGGKLTVQKDVTVENFNGNSGIGINISGNTSEVIIEESAFIYSFGNGIKASGGKLTIDGMVETSTDNNGCAVYISGAAVTVNENAYIYATTNCRSYGIKYDQTGKLTIKGGEICGYYGVFIVADNNISAGDVQLLGGMFSGGMESAIKIDTTSNRDAKLADVLETGYAVFEYFYDTAIECSETETGTETVIITKCTHKGVTSTSNNDGTHAELPLLWYERTGELQLRQICLPSRRKSIHGERNLRSLRL